MHSDRPARAPSTSLSSVTRVTCPTRVTSVTRLTALGAVAVLTCAALLGCGQPGSGSADLPAKDVAPGASSSGASTAVATTAASTGASPTAAASNAAATAASPSASSDATPGGAVAAAPSPTSASQPAPSGSASASGGPVASATAAASATASTSASASSAAAPEPALTVQSAKTQEAAFSVWMSSAKSYKVGQAGTVEVVLVPRGEYHCNEAYPYKVKLGAAPAGVTYGSDLVRGASVSASRASIRVPFTATAAGDARISGKFHFSVCTADQCVIDSREVATTVKIE